MNQPIEIPINKGKLFLGIGGSILFVMLGIHLMTTSTTSTMNPIFMKVTAIASILFFGATGIYGFKKLFDKKPGLIIDDRGVTDNSSAVSVGLIDWSDITEIEIKQIMTTNFLLIKVRNPEAYLEKAKNGMQRKLMQTNLKSYGTPITITSNTLSCDFGKLERNVREKFLEYGS